MTYEQTEERKYLPMLPTQMVSTKNVPLILGTDLYEDVEPLYDLEMDVCLLRTSALEAKVNR